MKMSNRFGTAVAATVLLICASMPQVQVVEVGLRSSTLSFDGGLPACVPGLGCGLR